MLYHNQFMVDIVAIIIVIIAAAASAAVAVAVTESDSDMKFLDKINFLCKQDEG